MEETHTGQLLHIHSASKQTLWIHFALKSTQIHGQSRLEIICKTTESPSASSFLRKSRVGDIIEVKGYIEHSATKTLIHPNECRLVSHS